MKNNNLILTIIVAIVVGAVGFFGGMQYQKSQRPNFANGQFLRQNGNGQRQFGNNRPVVGEIISKDDKSITVKLMDGSSKIVLVSGTTSINKAASGTMDDLKTGEQVAAFGTQNSDGSITAQNVQLNPQMRFLRGATGTPAAK